MDLSGWISGWAQQTPDKPAIIADGEILTYAAFAHRIEALAGALERRLGIGPGDRVAHLGENSPTQLALFFACARLGAMLVALNWRLAPPEHLQQLQDSAPKVLFADPGFFAHLDQIRERIRDRLPEMRCVGIGESAEGWAPMPMPVADVADDAPAAASPGYEAPVLLVYTSGATGRPKGAVLTQANIFWNAVNGAHAHDMSSADLILGNLPLFHVGGLNNQLTPALHCGASVLLHRRFDPAVTLAAIGRDRPTLALAAPTMMKALIEHPDWAGTDLSSLRLLMSGSTMVPVPLIRSFHARGVPVGQIYGATETAPIAIVLKQGDAFAHVGSCGRPAAHVRVRIVDREGCDLPDGVPGELLVKGPNVFSGYWRDAEATARALQDGWLRTGDIGRRDEDGFYYIEDRARDVIISGGENIYPAELEQILAEAPGLAECAVVGRPHPHWGEEPVIFAVPRAGEPLDREALLAMFQDRIARYKQPRHIIEISALPRNAMGKVLKHELRRRLREDQEEATP